MATTTRGYRYPVSGDAVNVNGNIQNLATDVDADVGTISTKVNTHIDTNILHVSVAYGAVQTLTTTTTSAGQTLWTGSLSVPTTCTLVEVVFNVENDMAQHLSTFAPSVGASSLYPSGSSANQRLVNGSREGATSRTHSITLFLNTPPTGTQTLLLTVTPGIVTSTAWKTWCMVKYYRKG